MLSIRLENPDHSKKSLRLLVGVAVNNNKIAWLEQIEKNIYQIPIEKGQSKEIIVLTPRTTATRSELHRIKTNPPKGVQFEVSRTNSAISLNGHIINKKEHLVARPNGYNLLFSEAPTSAM